MPDCVCILVTIHNVGVGDLMRCAIKVKRDYLPKDYFEYPMEYKSYIWDILPEHIRNCGNIVEIQEIFEVHIHE